MSFVAPTTSFKSVDEVNAHVEHITSKKVRNNDELILTSWFHIANLYHNVGADQQAEKYLREYLTVKRGNDPEAHHLLGSIYKKHNKYEQALKHYEKFLRSDTITHESILEAAEVCLNCAQNAQDEQSRIDLAVKGLKWLKKSRKSTKRKYSMSAIEMLISLYDFLIAKTSTTFWIDENIPPLFEADETYTNGHLHALILRALLRKGDFQIAWAHAWKNRTTFANSLEWNLFIKEDFDQLKLGIPVGNQDSSEDNDEPFELYLFALYNYLRISRLSCPSKYSQKSINEFRENVKAHELPSECNTVAVTERWKKIKSEYDSLGCLHHGIVCLSRAPKNLDFLLPMSKKWESKSAYKEALRSSCMSLRMCLSYNDNSNTSDLSLLDSNHMRVLIYQRQSDAAHTLLTLLRCFELSYLNANWDASYDVKEIAENKYGLPRAKVLRKETQLIEDLDGSYDVGEVVNVRNAFCFPKSSGVVYEMGSEQGGFLSMDVLSWFVYELETVDKVALQSRCFDLENVVELAAWYVESGKLRIWLREMFSRATDHPKLSELEQFAQKNLTPTIMDLESFLLLLLLQRHIKCVSRGGATTMGQILYLSAQREVWKVPEGAKKFWQSCLYHWGSEYPQKRYYAKDILSKSEIAQAVREIRGFPSRQAYVYSANAFNAHQRLYLALGIVYKNLMELNRLDCSVEIRHYFYAYNSWNKTASAEAENGKAKGGLKFLVFDDDINEDEYRSLIQISPFELEDIINSLQLQYTPIPEHFEALPTIPVNSYLSPRVENILNQPNTRYALAASPLPSSMETPGYPAQKSPSSPISPGSVQLNLEYFDLPVGEEAELDSAAFPDVSMNQLSYHLDKHTINRHDSDMNIPDIVLETEWLVNDRGDEEVGEMDSNIIPVPTRSMFDNDHIPELEINPPKPVTSPCSSTGSDYSGHSRRSSVTNPFTDTPSKSQWSPISSPLSEPSFRLPPPILSDDSTIERSHRQFEYGDRPRTLVSADDDFRKRLLAASWKDRNEEDQSETTSVVSLGFSDDDRSVASWNSTSTGSTSVSSRLSRQLRKLDAAKSPRESIRLLRSP